LDTKSQNRKVNTASAKATIFQKETVDHEAQPMSKVEYAQMTQHITSQELFQSQRLGFTNKKDNGSKNHSQEGKQAEHKQTSQGNVLQPRGPSEFLQTDDKPIASRALS